jgi:ArsR family transcriptional regulator, arsenate/arsenite/antimonite-responsive transcriptional repressor
MTSELPVLPGPPAAQCGAPAAGMNPDLDAERVAAVAKALSEPVRVQVFDVLRRSSEPVCQCEFVTLFDIKQSLLSHHLRKLVDAGLVDVERRHKWAFYSLAPGAVAEVSRWLS